MAKISNVDITSLLFQEGSAPSTPASTKWRAYFKTDGLYVIDDAGTETGPLGGAASFTGAHVYHNTTQAIGPSSWTALSLNQERFDTGTFHDNSTQNTRLTAPSDGYYMIGGNAEFAASATGVRFIRIFKGGTTVLAIHGPMIPDGAINTRMSISTLVFLSATNYVELQVWQNTAGNLNSVNAADYAPQFWIQKVG